MRLLPEHACYLHCVLIHCCDGKRNPGGDPVHSCCTLPAFMQALTQQTLHTPMPFAGLRSRMQWQMLMCAWPWQDANVVRVLARLRAVSGDPASREATARWAALAGALVDPQRPGDFNQARHGQPVAFRLRPPVLARKPQPR